jgi:hypothetical protein
VFPFVLSLGNSGFPFSDGEDTRDSRKRSMVKTKKGPGNGIPDPFLNKNHLMVESQGFAQGPPE